MLKIAKDSCRWYAVPMAKTNDRRATTLSISLTRELSRAVSERVESGLYTSASELIREALRLLLKAEPSQAGFTQLASETSPSRAGLRLASATELMELGQAIRAEKLRRLEPGLSEEEVQERLDALAHDLEIGDGLRVSPERLQKLLLDEEAPESR